MYCVTLSTMHRRIPMLDLFSGIGGFSFALHEQFRTVAYCEIDEYCQAILSANMSRGRIDCAPILNDVREVNRESLREMPKMVTAGWPCTDISCANPHGKGIDGARSGLVRHVFRLCDEIPEIECVLLENSPFIRTRGRDRLMDWFAERRFAVREVVLNATDVGAPHRRRRWFCLASRLGPHTELPHVKCIRGRDWSREPCSRLIPRSERDSFYINLCKRLGNSVVPQCVVMAYNSMLGRPVCSKIPPDLNLAVTIGHQRHTFKLWPSPNGTTWHQYHTFTDRSSRLLSNVMFYEDDTIAALPAGTARHAVYKSYIVNPCFVLWLLGYPADWLRSARI